MPLTHFLDSDGPDGVAMTVEADGAGSIFPVVYVRKAGRIEEHALASHPFHDFRSGEHRDQLASILTGVSPELGAASRA
jgi:hypothetical protein